MTNSELNKLSLSELRDLRNRVTEMLSLKMQIEGKINADSLKIGMTVKYIGGTNKIKDEKFKVVKINKVNAQCKSYSTGIAWNIKLANIEPCEDSEKEMPEKIVGYKEYEAEGRGER
jgi:hypothetical protein